MFSKSFKLTLRVFSSNCLSVARDRTSFTKLAIVNYGARNLVRDYPFFRRFYGYGSFTVFAISLFGKKSDDTKQREDEKLILEADLLYKNYYINNLYNLLESHFSSTNPEVLWRLARTLCEKAKQSKDLNEKKRLFNEALDVAKRSLEFEPSEGSFGAHKWFAIIQNYASELDGTKEQIKKSFDVKAHLERALEINSLDPTTWHILGVWHLVFADLPSHYRLAARILYAKPPESNFEEALRYFERAEALQPRFYSTNNYYLSLVYERLNRPDEALNQMKQAFLSPIISVDDKQTRTKAADNLKKKYHFTDDQLTHLLDENKDH